jgi:hypothetical protein
MKEYMDFRDVVHANLRCFISLKEIMFSRVGD